MTPDFQEGTKKEGITTADKGNITVYAKWGAVGVLRYYLYGADGKDGKDAVFSTFATDVSWNYPTELLEKEAATTGSILQRPGITQMEQIPH